MSKRVLFVDDEQSLLNGIERRLAGNFDLTTANSGGEALAKFDEHGPFAVVVTDMRMPKMDGVQLIKEARRRSPDTVYIMLTGNQDQATAIQALNEGHVFRFLTKPCQSTELIRAVDAGLRQYQLVTSERELLQNTFCGAVAVLTDVLELSHPNIFNRTERIQELVQSLQVELGLEDHWEYKLAARLGLLGLALLPDDERARFEVGVQSDVEFVKAVRQAAATGQRLIERIPRLSTVAKIIGQQPDVDGSAIIQIPRSEDAKATMGATLLRVAIQWDCLIRQGLSQTAAIDEMRRSLPRLSLEMIDALRNLPIEEDGGETVEVNVHSLEEGMVLCDDIMSGDGTMLIRNGRRLTQTIIERLRCYQSPGEKLRTIRVRAASVRRPEHLVLA